MSLMRLPLSTPRAAGLGEGGGLLLLLWRDKMQKSGVNSTRFHH